MKELLQDIWNKWLDVLLFQVQQCNLVSKDNTSFKETEKKEKQNFHLIITKFAHDNLPLTYYII